MNHQTHIEYLENILHNYFRFDKFREGQIEIIQSILSGKDTLAVLPTGGGKSLCFQLPSIITEGTAIVFSPLISLMKDQVDSLKKRGISSAYLNSSLSIETQKTILQKLTKGEYKIFFVAPERLLSHSFLNSISISKISLVVIDEAHCISEWGHNFRPMYLKIASIFQYIPRVPIACFTATATPEVRNDIIKYLNLENPNIFVKGFARNNLSFHTEVCKIKKERLMKIIKKYKNGSKIIYTGTRKTTEEISEYLNKNEIPSIAYHGGLNSKARKDIQEKFMTGELNTIVATNAFGMGIDKPDVRLVIHLDLPTTLEAYYQEAGRAGRDGLESDCYLLYSKNDEKLPSLFIFGAFPDIIEINKVIKGINALVNLKRNKYLQGKISELAVLFNIESTKLRAILKLLKRKEIIEFYDDAHLLKFSVAKENPDFHKINKNFHKFRKEIFDYLINYNENSKEILDLKNISDEFSVSIESILTEIKSFESLGLIHISHNSLYSGIKIKQGKIDENIAEEMLNEVLEKKEIMLKKADIVLDYLRTDICKQNFILNYFGEFSPDFICGKCSTCMGEQTDISLLQDAHIHNFSKGISKKNKNLLQLFEKLNLHLENESSFDSIAVKMKLTKPELANLMQTAIEDGWIVKDIPFIKKEKLSQVRAILSKNPNQRLSQVREKISFDIEYPELRILVALARKL